MTSIVDTPPVDDVDEGSIVDWLVDEYFPLMDDALPVPPLAPEP